ncbi:OsmC family protein [Tropicimonas marinistellae]|uniref:OsmC family protein n=1 Tax=Tropicimonas marinistellae TaxID=1739787 RepID=UPI00082E461F|nr:OsmC family protein [Tropicimonas marinistellae]
MVVRIKPKSFGPVRVRSEGGDTLLYARNGEAFDTAPPQGTPVELLLLSLGACIAKSLKIVADQPQTHLSPFTVEVTGQKATDLPNRLGSVDIRVLGRLTDDAEKSAELLRKAKSICTVSNSMNCTIALELDRSG